MFDSIIGHSGTLSRLQAAVQARTIPQAVLFEGPSSSGKLSTALELARVLNCQSNAEKNCHCWSCSGHRDLSDPHVVILGGRDFAGEISAAARTLQRSDSPSAQALFVRSVRSLTRRFDDILWSGSEPRLRRLRPQVAALEEKIELMRTDGAAAIAADLAYSANLESVSVNAVRAIESWMRVATPGVKIVIIEVRRWLPEPTSNALLRTVEDPLSRAHVIFTAPSSRGLLPTLLSRLSRYQFGERSADEHAQVLSQVFGETKVAGRSVADHLQGQEAEASSLNDKNSLKHVAAELCEAALTGNEWDVEGVPNNRERAFLLLQACSEYLRAQLRLPDRRFPVNEIERCYRFVDDAAWRVKAMNMSLEATLVDIVCSIGAGSEPPVRRA